ncbi:hypothetical protein QE152_g37884 [Popillia japonica]|uniref:Uncharacterized protein n=1 Tax=Popillia japonica TaxID=7064 RepID=A0AAW1I920_POPJA
MPGVQSNTKPALLTLQIPSILEEFEAPKLLSPLPISPPADARQSRLSSHLATNSCIDLNKKLRILKIERSS